MRTFTVGDHVKIQSWVANVYGVVDKTDDDGSCVVRVTEVRPPFDHEAVVGEMIECSNRNLYSDDGTREEES